MVGDVGRRFVWSHLSLLWAGRPAPNQRALRRALGALALVGGLAGASAAEASAQTTVVLPATATCMITSATGNGPNELNEWCDHHNMAVGFRRLTPTGPLHEYRSLVRFDWASIPRNAVVTSATLRMRPRSPVHFPGALTTAPHQVAVHNLTAPFIEEVTGANWYFRQHNGQGSDGEGGEAEYWQTPGGDFEAAAVATTSVQSHTQNTPAEWQVTATVQKWIADLAPRFGFLLRSSESSGGIEMCAGSSCTTLPKPELEVTYFIPRVGIRETDSFDTYDITRNTKLRVNLANGNLVLQTTEFPDFQVSLGGTEDVPQSLIPGTSNLSGSRFWNSFDIGSGAFGVGGRLGAGTDVRLRVNGQDNSRTLAAPSGYEVKFTPSPNGGFTSPPDFPGTLTQNPNGTSTIELHTGEQLDFSAWNNGAGGFLTRWSNVQEMAADFASTAGANDFALGTNDDLTSFTGSPRITQANSPSGQLAYTYTSGRLVGASGPSGSTTYGYSGDRLTSIDAPSGSNWTIEYHDDGRAWKVVEHPTSGPSLTNTYVYSATTTTATYPARTFTYRIDASRSYVERVDTGASPPSIGLTGALITAKPALSAASQYDLDVTVADADGISQVGVFVNGELVAGDDDLCPSSPCVLNDIFTLDTAVIGPGIHHVEVVASDDAGAQRTERFWVSIPPEPFTSIVPEPAVDSTSEPEVAHAKDFRAQFGLNAADSHVRAVQANPAYASAAADYGVYLTPSEEAQMANRRALEDATPAIDNYGALHPGEYSDLYIDSAGTVHVGFTANVAQHENALEGIFAYPAQLNVRTTAYSRNALAAVADEVWDDRAELAGLGIDVLHTVERVRENDVEVGVRDLTPSQATYLENRYGPSITVVESFGAAGGASRHDKQRPLLAGLAIHNVNGQVPADNLCTLGFAAHGHIPIRVHRQGRVETDHYQHTNFYMSAGHCAFFINTSSWKQGGVFDSEDDEWEGGWTFGATYGYSVRESSATDSMLISLNNRKDLSTYIWASRYRDSTTGKRYTQRVGGVTDESQDDAGKGVCISGVQSYVRCGSVSDLRMGYDMEYDLRDGGKTKMRLRALRRMSFTCRKGDSGAPVWIKDKKAPLVDAIGIVVGFVKENENDTTGPCLYAHIAHSLNILKTDLEMASLTLHMSPGGNGDMRFP